MILFGNKYLLASILALSTTNITCEPQGEPTDFAIPHDPDTASKPTDMDPGKVAKDPTNPPQNDSTVVEGSAADCRTVFESSEAAVQLGNPYTMGDLGPRWEVITAVGNASVTLRPTQFLEFALDNDPDDGSVDLCHVPIAWRADIAKLSVDIDEGLRFAQERGWKGINVITAVGGLNVWEFGTWNDRDRHIVLNWYLQPDRQIGTNALHQALRVPAMQKIDIHYVELAEPRTPGLALGFSASKDTWPHQWAIMTDEERRVSADRLFLGQGPAPQSPTYAQARKRMENRECNVLYAWDCARQGEVAGYQPGAVLAAGVSRLLGTTVWNGHPLYVHFVWSGRDGGAYVTTGSIGPDGATALVRTLPFSAEAGTCLPSVDIMRSLEPPGSITVVRSE